MLTVTETAWQCWHGTYVLKKGGQWWHPNSETPCDDPSPMYKP